MVERIRLEAKRLAAATRGEARTRPYSLAEMAALAYPDRIGLRRKGEAPRWVLSGGKGAAMAAGLPLSGARLIVATDLDGDAREATIRQAVAISEAEVRRLYADRIAWVEVCDWSRREGRVLSRRQERLGALVLDDRHWDAPVRGGGPRGAGGGAGAWPALDAGCAAAAGAGAAGAGRGLAGGGGCRIAWPAPRSGFCRTWPA